MPTPAVPTINQIGGADSVVSSQPGDSVVTGTTGPGSAVVLAFNGSPLGSAIVAADGAWAYALTAANITALGQGIGKTITATATDAGGTSGPTTSAPFGVDNLAPFTTINPVGGTDAIIGNGSEAADQTITGTTEAGATVTLTFGTNAPVSATVSGTNWTYSLTAADITALGQGTGKTITATATDAGGTSSPTTSAPFGVDNLAPFTTINQIGGADSVVSSQSGDSVVTGTTGPGSTVVLAFNGSSLGSATVEANGAWSYALTAANITALGQGTGKTITATATDASGTSSPATSTPFGVDTIPPVVTAVTAAPSDAVVGPNVMVTLTLGLSEPATVDTAGGTPTLTLNNGGAASYVSGSGTNALTFDYTVGAGQDVSDLAVTGVNLNGATIVDPANNSADVTGAIMNPAGTLSVKSINALDVTTGQPVGVVGQAYTGPVAGLESEYINITGDKLNVAAGTPNWFIHTGNSDDAIVASSGINVLDGGTGSNFLTGGSGSDTFFVDNRGESADTWSTIVNFGAGDAVTIWGVTPQDFNFDFEDGQGASGYTGLTLHATAPGRPTASVTFAGYTTADLADGRISESSGTDPVSGSTFTYFHANT